MERQGRCNQEERRIKVLLLYKSGFSRNEIKMILRISDSTLKRDLAYVGENLNAGKSKSLRIRSRLIRKACRFLGLEHATP